MLRSPKDRRVAAIRFNIRMSVKRIGKKKTRSQSKHYLAMCEGYQSLHKKSHIEEYKQACRDVLGGEW